MKQSCREKTDITSSKETKVAQKKMILSRGGGEGGTHRN